MLRDFYCTECGTDVGEHDVDFDVVRMLSPCVKCDAIVEVAAKCNGGTKTRYRFCDLSENPLDYEGQTRLIGTGCYTADSDDVPDINGMAIDARDKFQDGDHRSERRDKIVHREKAKQGRTPIFFTPSTDR